MCKRLGRFTRFLGDLRLFTFGTSLQGASAALMVPLILTLITSAYPPEQQCWAIGIWSGCGT